jgi:hypothetical protein
MRNANPNTKGETMIRIARVNGRYRVWRGRDRDRQHFNDRSAALDYAAQLWEIFGGDIVWGATPRYPI